MNPGVDHCSKGVTFEDTVLIKTTDELDSDAHKVDDHAKGDLKPGKNVLKVGGEASNVNSASTESRGHKMFVRTAMSHGNQRGFVSCLIDSGSPANLVGLGTLSKIGGKNLTIEPLEKEYKLEEKVLNA